MAVGPALRAEIESLFQVIHERSTDSELVFLCPECGDETGNRAINLETGMTNCWRCDKGSTGKGLFTAWAKAMGYELTGRVVYTADSWKEAIRRMNVTTVATSEDYVQVELPQGFTLLKEKPDSGYSTLIREMAERKNLTFEDLARANAGYTTDDAYWEPYCIFPVIERGKVVYYQGRTYVDVPGETTKRFPSRKYCPFGARYWVYGIDIVHKRRATKVIVVESILNVLSLRRKLKAVGVRDVVPVCVFKHAISVAQLLKIRRAGVKEVCVLFDRDAINNAWKTGHASDLRFSIAEMPEVDGHAKLDANDDVDAAYDAYLKRQSVTFTMRTLNQIKTQKVKFRVPRQLKAVL